MLWLVGSRHSAIRQRPREIARRQQAEYLLRLVWEIIPETRVVQRYVTVGQLWEALDVARCYVPLNRLKRFQEIP